MKQFFKINRQGRVGVFLLTLSGSVILVGILFYAALQLRPDASRGTQLDQQLTLYCAAGVAKPVQEILEKYNAEFNARIKIDRTGGSGELAGQIKTESVTGIRRGADLYVTADQTLLEKARSEGLIAETFDLAVQRPVVAVRANENFDFDSFQEVTRSKNIRFGICSPRAAVGKLVRQIASRDGFSTELEDNKVTEFENVMTLGQALVTGSIDAALIWDTTVAQINQNTENLPDVKICCPADPLNEFNSNIAIGIISNTDKPTHAIRLARYLTAAEKSAAVFSSYGFTFIPGDEWEPTPEIHLYCGSMFTPVIEESVRKFASREGINLYPKWEGCGKLVTRMKMSDGSSRFPDAYFACDQMFLDQVKESFQQPVIVSENDIVIAVRRDLQVDIDKVEDLVAKRIRVGICDPEQSALGSLTQKMMENYPVEGFYNKLSTKSAVAVDVGPTLVSQLLAGGLDAAIVYRSNIWSDQQALEQLRVIALEKKAPYSVATQPWAVSKSTRFPKIMHRLFASIQDEQHRKKFEQQGFRLVKGQSE